MNKGFTLIELLVTVAILGILATLSFSSLFEFKKRAQRASVEVIMNDIHTALQSAALYFPTIQPGTSIAGLDYYRVSFGYFPGSVGVYCYSGSFCTEVQKLANQALPQDKYVSSFEELGTVMVNAESTSGGSPVMIFNNLFASSTVGQFSWYHRVSDDAPMRIWYECYPWC